MRPPMAYPVATPVGYEAVSSARFPRRERKEVAGSPTALALVIFALWVLLGILGAILHVLRALLILALIGTVIVLVFGRRGRSRRG
jgi:uncharacterized membrane protein